MQHKLVTLTMAWNLMKVHPGWSQQFLMQVNESNSRKRKLSIAIGIKLEFIDKKLEKHQSPKQNVGRDLGM